MWFDIIKSFSSPLHKIRNLSYSFSLVGSILKQKRRYSAIRYNFHIELCFSYVKEESRSVPKMEKKSWYHDKTAEEEFAKKNCVQGILPWGRISLYVYIHLRWEGAMQLELWKVDSKMMKQSLRRIGSNVG